MRTTCQSISLLVWLVGLFAIQACKPGVPRDYIQPDEMEEIIYDFHLGQAVVMTERDALQNYDRRLAFLQVLEKHGITEAEFDSSLVYYYSHAYRMKDIYQHVNDRLEKQAVALGATTGELSKYAQASLTGDTANIWNGRQAVVLMPVAPYNRMDFCIDADSSFKKGDSFLLNMNSNFVYQSGTKDATAYVMVEYDKDSIGCFTSNIYMSGLTQLRIPANHDMDIKRIKGFIYLDQGSETNSTLKLLFISDLQLVRFHSQSVDSVEVAVSSAADSLAVPPSSQDTLMKERALEKKHLPHPAISLKRRPVD